MKTTPVVHYDYNKLMTAEQFIHYAKSVYEAGEEWLGEAEAQFASECALFGDAGPGQGIAIRETKLELATIRARYTWLTGRDLRDDAFPLTFDQE